MLSLLNIDYIARLELKMNTLSVPDNSGFKICKAKRGNDKRKKEMVSVLHF
jgi:hypothetical protein